MRCYRSKVKHVMPHRCSHDSEHTTHVFEHKHSVLGSDGLTYSKAFVVNRESVYEPAMTAEPASHVSF